MNTPEDLSVLYGKPDESYLGESTLAKLRNARLFSDEPEEPVVEAEVTTIPITFVPSEPVSIPVHVEEPSEPENVQEDFEYYGPEYDVLLPGTILKRYAGKGEPTRDTLRYIAKRLVNDYKEHGENGTKRRHRYDSHRYSSDHIGRVGEKHFEAKRGSWESYQKSHSQKGLEPRRKPNTNFIPRPAEPVASKQAEPPKTKKESLQDTMTRLNSAVVKMQHNLHEGHFLPASNAHLTEKIRGYNPTDLPKISIDHTTQQIEVEVEMPTRYLTKLLNTNKKGEAVIGKSHAKQVTRSPIERQPGKGTVATLYHEIRGEDGTPFDVSQATLVLQYMPYITRDPQDSMTMKVTGNLTAVAGIFETIARNTIPSNKTR